MKITGSILLLLLVCSVSTGQTVPSQATTKAPNVVTAKVTANAPIVSAAKATTNAPIVSAAKATTKAPNVVTKTVSPQQISLQGTYAALRQLTASLAQQKVEIQSLQRETKAQAVKLRNQEAEINKLKQQQQVKQVAFSASLSAGNAETIGPFSSQTPLVFKHVITNTREVYNLKTGVFTAPVRGAYHFEWHVGAPGDASHSLDVHLVKNKNLVFSANERQLSGYQSASQGVTLILQAKDAVFLRLGSGSKVSDNEHHQSTFSGHLLFTI